MGEDKEEFPLLLKEITTLDLSNPNLYQKKKKITLTILVKISSYKFFLITKENFI